jgi:hypothetical protein
MGDSLEVIDAGSTQALTGIASSRQLRRSDVQGLRGPTKMKSKQDRGDRSHVSWVAEYAFERQGRWLREVTLDFHLEPDWPQGGAQISVSCEIPADIEDPRWSEVVQRANRVALDHLNRALALAECKITEDAFQDVVSRQSHRVAHEFLRRALRVAREKAGEI